jgi:membrane-bound lytic murein transglycosylase MltF
MEMNLLARQSEVADKIRKAAIAIGLDPAWCIAVAMTESSLGENQKSPTGCRGVFQMSAIAMKDLLQEMEKQDDDIIDIACGLAFLHLLLKRHKTIEAATAKFCAPGDRDFYVSRVVNYMEVFKGEV